MEHDLRVAIENIIWKLNRKTMDSDGQCHWAKIDIKDVVIRDAKKALAESFGDGLHTGIFNGPREST